MLKRICILLCALICCLPAALCSPVLASSLDTQAGHLSPQERNSFWDNIALEVVAEEPSAEPISCFDVNSEGQVAFGFRGSSENTILVYSKDCEFLYGYTFQSYGSYYIFWEQNNICIYFVRSRVVATVDPNGKCVDICDAEAAGVDSNKLKVIQSSSKEVNGIQYQLENDMIIGDQFGRLRVLNPDGTEYVFYDVTEQHNTRVIATIISVFLFTTIVTFMAIKRSSGCAKGKGGLTSEL